jgi:hypothetical protein
MSEKLRKVKTYDARLKKKTLAINKRKKSKKQPKKSKL